MTMCSVEGCPRPARGRGWCTTHYMRWRRTGSLERTVADHGMSNEPIYRVWKCMRSRCTKPSNRVFKHYGGRGISVCDAWLHDFMSFYDHVSALPHFDEAGRAGGRSLDRIDNDGDYEPGNVRWATHSEQQSNKSRAVLDTH